LGPAPFLMSLASFSKWLLVWKPSMCRIGAPLLWLAI
jgi:hypothetical protein